jgi:hypothetical protein
MHQVKKNCHLQKAKKKCALNITLVPFKKGRSPFIIIDFAALALAFRKAEHHEGLIPCASN